MRFRETWWRFSTWIRGRVLLIRFGIALKWAHIRRDKMAPKKLNINALATAAVLVGEAHKHLEEKGIYEKGKSLLDGFVRKDDKEPSVPLDPADNNTVRADRNVIIATITSVIDDHVDLYQDERKKLKAALEAALTPFLQRQG